MTPTHRPTGALLTTLDHFRPLGVVQLSILAGIAAVVTVSGAALGATWMWLRDIDITNTLLCGDDDD